eukprot:Platyproteum_vivax@DN5013_c0_g1_i1.p1
MVNDSHNKLKRKSSTQVPTDSGEGSADGTDSNPVTKEETPSSNRTFSDLPLSTNKCARTGMEESPAMVGTEGKLERSIYGSASMMFSQQQVSSGLGPCLSPFITVAKPNDQSGLEPPPPNCLPNIKAFWEHLVTPTANRNVDCAAYDSYLENLKGEIPGPLDPNLQKRAFDIHRDFSTMSAEDRRLAAEQVERTHMLLFNLIGRMLAINHFRSRNLEKLRHFELRVSNTTS